ncbi:MAG: alpha/beta hydrolase [Pseudohongiellaceae bacterium]
MCPLIIIHGWSDEDQSFLPLARALEQRTGRPVESLWLGNYVSLDDDILMSDLVAGLSRAWRKAKLPETPGSVDVIVHSTGGLVIRDWMATRYSERKRKPPVRNLVMLAPANTGSPLAHKGRAFYGRVMKGFSSRKRFHTGTQILKALEMASPYSTGLAVRDRFMQSPFRPGGVRATTIVGNTGYSGISSLANEDGSDGTVYVATANPDCARLTINFPANMGKAKASAIQSAKGGETAFLVLDDHNHSTVALKEATHPGNEELLADITRALEIPNAGEYRDWVADCRQRTAAVMEKHAGKRDTHKHGFQNTVIRLRDDQGNDVPDYVVEFYGDAASDADDLATEFNRRVLTKVHAYKDNSAIRSFMINCTELHRLFTAKGHSLRISLSALPDINDPKNVVGYQSFETDDIDCLTLGPEKLKAMFVENRTLFVEITLARVRKDGVFGLERVDSY